MKRLGSLVFFGVLVFTSVPRLEAKEHVWIEGEAPASINFKPNIAGWGRKEFLSGEKWLQVSIDADKVEKDAPQEGILISYPFRTPAQAAYEISNRIGFESVRSPFSWRVDDGPWTEVSPEELTTDLMEIDFFCEVAWLKLGSKSLEAGDHTLEVKLSKTKNKEGKYNRILYACDALCITAGTFHPNGKFPPGEDGRDAKDRQAGEAKFSFPPLRDDAKRAESPLAGVWEICRDDEQLPGEVATPIARKPSHPFWRAITVPGDKNNLRPDLLFAHRLWYRARVELPAGASGRSWHFVFPQNSLNTTVFVNDRLCGFGKDPFARFQVDITKAVKPGLNEVWVGIRDAWYARTANPDDPLKLRKTFNLPRKFFHDGFQDLAYPVWSSPQSGILTTPTLVAAGDVYASDVFVKPSVARKRLGVEVELANTKAIEVSGELRWEAVDAKTGAVAKAFPSKSFRLRGDSDATVALEGDWPNPKLWWPNDPYIYRLRTTVVVDGRPIDVKETSFGFREWRVEGTKFTLNGVVWHLWGDVFSVTTNKEDWLQQYRKSGQRLMRLATAGQGGESSGWMGMSPDEALDFFDREGVVVRRNSTLDGEAIGYSFSESDPAIKKRNGGSELKAELMKNVRDQFVAQVKGERNHPSIQIWSMENEFAYINLINLLGNSPLMDAYEREEQKIADAVTAVDPTRPVMADGGGAFKENTMPVHGDHYVATLDARYPDLAYEAFSEGGGRGRWRWDQKRPRYIGEDYFARGITPADYAMWGGEAAFQGRAQASEAVGLLYRMLMEGYRWGGHYAAWHLWLGNDAPGQYGSSPWRAAFVRQYDWTFGASQKVHRTFGLFNDTQFSEPLTFTRSLSIAGKMAWTKSTEHAVPPGASVKFDEDVEIPSASRRQEAELLLALSVGGKEVFRDAKAVSILPDSRPALIAAIGANDRLAVFDPRGEVASFLRSAKASFTQVANLEELPSSAKVLLIGRDAIEESDSTSSRLAAFAAPGRTVVVLEQKHPLKYQATPAGLEPAPITVRDGAGVEATINEGRTAFIEDTAHHVFRGLLQKDFFTWGPDHVVYRNAYLKPTKNGRSLVQVGPRLQNTALVESPAGKGTLLLCQLEVGKKLATNAVAQRLLVNLLEYGAHYKQEFREVAAVSEDPLLLKTLDAIGLRYTRVSDPLQAIGRPEIKLALISATPANLKALAGGARSVNAFTQRGGFLLLHGLTPEGLADYNQLVGFEHVIRPFRRERVTFPAVRDPLTAGLTNGDVVMLSGERMFPWAADEYLASDVFTFVVDHDDVAPFASSPFHAYGLITNGFVGTDGWPLNIDFPAPKDGKPFAIPIQLPRREKIEELKYIASTNYWPTTQVNLVFDGKVQEKIEFKINPTNEPQTLTINPPRPAKDLTLEVAAWIPSADKAANVGIDDIVIKAQRSPEYKKSVRPILNIGGLMHYVRGDGGIVLDNINLKEVETVPINADKKRTILATILKNLKAPFSGGKTVIAGSNLVYVPIDLSKHANQFRNERGWFGDAKFTFAGLPSGKQTFAGVTYNVYDFATSPVPTVVMLGGSGVPNNPPEEVRGIPVHAKADALFFLQAARIDQRRNAQEVVEKTKFEIARYVVHYVDGKQETIPIFSEIDVDDYRQAAPAPLPGARVAWTKRYDGSDLSAVAYAKQWDNPRPSVEIQSLDFVAGSARARGVSALIAVTAASANP